MFQDLCMDDAKKTQKMISKQRILTPPALILCLHLNFLSFITVYSSLQFLKWQ